MEGQQPENLGLYQENVPAQTPESFSYPWVAGVFGGVTGGVGMGLILHVGGVIPFIGALYGWPTVLGGWTAHLINSVLIGLLFAAILSRPVVREQTTSVTECLVLGTVYAAAVGLVTGGLMLPISATALGAGALPHSPFPASGVLGGGLVAVSVGVAHLVYGLLLGATYGVLNN